MLSNPSSDPTLTPGGSSPMPERVAGGRVATMMVTEGLFPHPLSPGSPIHHNDGGFNGSWCLDPLPPAAGSDPGAARLGASWFGTAGRGRTVPDTAVHRQESGTGGGVVLAAAWGAVFVVAVDLAL